MTNSLRFAFMLFAAVLTFLAQAQVFPTTKIKDAGPDAERINFVILAEGYQSSEVALFNSDATNISTLMFGQSPLSNYTNFFNLHTIAVTSVDSGSDHPATAGDEPTPPDAIRLVDTYLNMTFDFGGIHRLPYANSLAPVFSVLATNYPAYDQAIVLINESQYGGAGGTIATTSTHSSAGEIAIHEIGHSFAGLNDEYWAGTQFARENYNMTAESNPAIVKWADWVGTAGIGVYPFGSSSPQSNWYRPHQSCKMRQLGVDFCAVCSERMVDRIYELVDPIENKLPSSGSQSFLGTDITFSIGTIDPIPNTLSVEWLLDGVVVASGTTSYTFGVTQAISPTHTLLVRVTDATTLSKSYAPASGYVFEEQWTISNSVPLPVEWLSFDVSEEKTFNLLEWSTASERNSDSYLVERKLDDGWEIIGTVEAAKNSDVKQDYTFIDNLTKPGITYYRIQQKDQDGKIEYTDERTVSRVTRWFYSVYPNPTTGPLALEVYTDRDTDLEVIITDASGKIFTSQTLALVAGRNRNILELDHLTPGTFFVQLIRQDNQWNETLQLINE